MKEKSKNQLIDLINKAEEVNKDLADTAKFDRKELERIAEEYTNKSSEYLAAISGGIFGFSGGFAISVFGGISLISGGLGAVLGAALGILIWRGRGQHKLERGTKKYELASAIILQKIKNLPDNTPQDVKDQLWEMYRVLNTRYAHVVIDSLGDDGSNFDKLLEEKKK